MKHISYLKTKIHKTSYSFFLLLFSLNLFGKGYVFFLVLVVNALIISIVDNNRFFFDRGFSYIILFSFSYYLILQYHRIVGLSSVFYYFVGPIAAYIIGQLVTSQSWVSVRNYIFIIVFGNFIHGLMNVAYATSLYGFSFFFSGLRSFPDIWSQDMLTATLQGTFYTLTASLLFYSITIIKEELLVSFMIIAMVIFSLLASVLMGNRTLLYITGFVFLASFIMYSKLEKRKIRVIRILFLICILVLLFYLFYAANFFELRDIIDNSLLVSRMKYSDTLKDPRLSVYFLALKQIFLYPFGGYRMYLGGLSYAHNLWLDVLYATGLIPFMFLLLFSIYVLINLYKLIKMPSLSLSPKLLWFGIYAGYMLNFMVEPILEGVPMMFISFCFISGMLSNYYMQKKLLNTRVP